MLLLLLSARIAYAAATALPLTATKHVDLLEMFSLRRKLRPSLQRLAIIGTP